MPIDNMPLLAVTAPLNLTTLIVVLIAAAAVFLVFMRRKSNRHPMDTPKGEAAEEMRRREAEEGTVAVRRLGSKEQEVLALGDAVGKLSAEAESPAAKHAA